MINVTCYILTKGYTVPGDQDTHDKLNQIQNRCQNDFFQNVYFQVTPMLKDFVTVLRNKEFGFVDLLHTRLTRNPAIQNNGFWINGDTR